MVITTIESELGGANRHQSSIGNVSGLASCQVLEAGSGHCGESSKHPRKFRVGTLSVNALRGRVCEVLETLSHRKEDICCFQETIYRGGICRTVNCKDTRYKLYSGEHILWWQLPHIQGQGLQVQVYWSGNNKGTAGVGVFVAKEWIEKVSEVQ